MKIYQLIILTLFMLTSACSNEDNSSSDEQSSDNFILKDQKLAMEKARQVEQLLQSSIENKSKLIDEQSQ
ncbi:MAG: hypothetical protein KZQ83_00375 [gamma proteobacterium symbiont of Taylorina sp.]|nr:hypothetical protein [gamma proteobacterium symbiont of Taylorina sp.]